MKAARVAELHGRLETRLDEGGTGRPGGVVASFEPVTHACMLLEAGRPLRPSRVDVPSVDDEGATGRRPRRSRGTPMLEAIHLKNFGRAPAMAMTLAPRRKLITGLGRDGRPRPESDLSTPWLFAAHRCAAFDQRWCVRQVGDARADGVSALVDDHQFAPPLGGGRRSLEQRTRARAKAGEESA